MADNHEDLGFVPDSKSHEDLGFVPDQPAETQQANSSPIQQLNNQGFNFDTFNQLSQADKAQFMEQNKADARQNAETIGLAGSQGASIGGLGKDLAPFVSAALPTATDEAMNRTYTDRVVNAKNQIEKSSEKSVERSPYLHYGTQVVSSIPKSMSLSKVLGEMGLTSGKSQGAVSGALEGLTQSKKETTGRTLVDGILGGLLGTLTGGTLDKLAGNSKASTTLVDDFGNITGKAVDPLRVTKIPTFSAENAKDGAIKVGVNDFGSGADAFRLSKEQGKSLLNKNFQAEISDEVEALPSKIEGAINQTKADLGQTWQPLLKQYGAAPANSTNALKKAWSSTSEIIPENDEIVQKSLDAWKDRLGTIGTSLKAKSPTGSLDDVPMSAISDEMEKLGDLIWGKNKAYIKAPSVRKTAQDTYFALKDAFGAADKPASGGQLAKINDVFAALYKMSENNDLTESKIGQIFDSTKGSGRAVYEKLINPFLKLDLDTRVALAPKMQEFLGKDVAATLTKKALLDSVSLSSGEKLGMLPLLSKIPKGSYYGGMSMLGVASQPLNSLPAIAQSVNQGALSASPGLATGALAPVAGNALQGSLKNRSALRELK